MRLDMTTIIEMFSRAIDDSIVHISDSPKPANYGTKYPNSHQFKVAHFIVHLAKELGMTDDELYDIFLLGLFHNMGFLSTEIVKYISNEYILEDYESLVSHCLIGELLIKKITFKTIVKNVITFHHERYDGTGFFGVVGEDIPIFSRLIFLGSQIDALKGLCVSGRDIEDIYQFLRDESGKKFDPKLVDIAIKVLKEHPGADYSIRCGEIPVDFVDSSWNELSTITKSFMEIIDHKSSYTFLHSKTITKYAELLCKHYKIDDDKFKMIYIAANLHDIGKIYLPQSILEKPIALKNTEYDMVKKHSIYGEQMLKRLEGFEEIAIWIGQHHEKLDGSGYPRGLKGDEISFEAQILTVCDIFTALMEDRPYRLSFNFNTARNMLVSMAKKGEINEIIVRDLIDIVESNILKMFREKD